MKLHKILILSMVLCLPAKAEYGGDEYEPRESQPRMLGFQTADPFSTNNFPMDQPDPMDGQLYEEPEAPKGPSVPWLRLNLIGGLSNVQPTGNSTIVEKTFSAGLSADATIKNYFGFEAEGFYGAGTAEGTSGEHSLSQLAANGMARLQLPFQMGSFRLIPKVMGGYGFNSLNTDIASSTSVQGSTLTVHGITVGYGVELQGLGNFIFTFDMARSITSTGSLSTTGSNGSQAIDAGFDRIRFGAYYRVAQGFMIGAQYQDRRVNADFGSSNVVHDITQFTGSIGIEF